MKKHIVIALICSFLLFCNKSKVYDVQEYSSKKNKTTNFKLYISEKDSTWSFCYHSGNILHEQYVFNFNKTQSYYASTKYDSVKFYYSNIKEYSVKNKTYQLYRFTNNSGPESIVCFWTKEFGIVYRGSEFYRKYDFIKSPEKEIVTEIKKQLSNDVNFFYNSKLPDSTIKMYWTKPIFE
jgi:hypothetical protein